MTHRLSAEERFWQKADTSGECWTWTASTFSDGYGQFWVKGRPVGAHRFSYQINVGPIPDGMLVDHKCFNPPCVNPNHLRVVSDKQNNQNRSGAPRNSKSGVRGVIWQKRLKKWWGRVGHNNEIFDVGYFADLKEAEAAVIAKRIELHTHNDLDRQQQKAS